MIVVSFGLLAAFLVAMLWLPSLWSGAAQPEATQPEPTLTSENAGELCLRLSEYPKDYMTDDARRRRWDLRDASCKMALDAAPSDLQLKVTVARNLPYARKEEAIAIFREAAAQGSAEAYYELYEHHKSWDRGDLDKVPLVNRAEADRALHEQPNSAIPLPRTCWRSCWTAATL